MTTFNKIPDEPIEVIYQKGLLPQRNQKGLFYQSTSCRSNLKQFSLSSENRRIIKKTDSITFSTIPLKQFDLTGDTLKQIHYWQKIQNWDFPTASVKTVFKNHIFNHIYIWSDKTKIIGYSICLLTPTISHIAYIFYDPEYQRLNLSIRMVLQFIIDSHQLNLDYCYLGQFSNDLGFYKRTMPGFEYFVNNSWQKLS